MNNKELVRLDLLNRKIYEYFSKHPKSKSAVFKMEIGGDKTHWKVTRSSGNLKIVEVKSQTKKFVMEAPIGQVQAHEDDVMQQQAAAQQAAMAQQAATQAPPPPAPPPGAPMTPMSAAPMAPTPQPPVPMAPPPMAAPPLAAPVAPPAEPTGVGTGAAQAAMQAVEQAKISDPEGFAQFFGATPQAQLQNPNTPPHLAINGDAPDQRGGQQIAAGADPLTEAGVEYTNMRNLFMQAVDQPTVPNLQAATTAIGSALSGLNPQEKASAESMLQALATWQGKGADPTANAAADIIVKGPPGAGPASFLSHKTRKGKKLREAPGNSFPVDAKKKEPGINPGGIEATAPAAADDASSQPDIPFEPGTSEEQALVRNLKGQTIKDVTLENDNNIVRVEFDLATTDWPATLEWERGGKLTFIMKDRRYVLHKKWT